MANQQRQQTGQDIQVMEGLEAIRLRPGMYVGGTDIHALHHLVYEAVDNAIDEAMAGRCDFIQIVIHADGSITVSDNGGGIPVEEHWQYPGMSTLEVVFTNLHAGGKFGSGAYTVSGGLHGIGIKAINALSTWTVAEVRRDGFAWQQTYERGKRTSGVEKVRQLEPDEPTGTYISFLPDDTIMQVVDFNFEMLANRFREMAYVTRGVTIRLVDERLTPFPRQVTYYFEGGLASFVRYLNLNRSPIHEVVSGTGSTPFMMKLRDKEVEASMETEFAFQYSDTTNITELAFANTINTPDGGTHLTGLRTALTRVINNYARKAGFLKEKDANFTGRHTLEGLTAIVSVRHPGPQFESQTKVKLMNPEVTAAVAQVVSEKFADFLESSPKDARRIVEKCMTAQRIQDALDKQRELLLGERKSLLANTTLPGKLADCSDKGSNTELYIVEGDSAGGCFSGDTEIALVEGRSISFRALVEEQAQGKTHFCYTIRNDGTIGVEQILDARVTKRNAQVIRLTLDNGEQIVCTPDHRFLLRNGEYKAAEQLTSDDCLMPLYRKVSDLREPGITIDGYEMAWDPRSEKWMFTHQLADWYNRWKGVYTQASGEHCHHIDFNKHNNNPTNLVRLSADDHLALHRQHVANTLHRPDVIEKCRQVRQSDEFRAMMSDRMKQPQTRQILSAQAKAQWENPEYATYMREKWRKFYEADESYRQANNQRLIEAQTCYWAEETNRQSQAERVRTYFVENPGARMLAAIKAKRQWQDSDLVTWRSNETRKQWTPEFRVKRKAALHQTYYNKTLAALKSIEVKYGAIDLEAYQSYRLETRDKSLLRFDTFCERYFENDKAKALEAVHLYNHRIRTIEVLDTPMDVYDIEVPFTHNFALASGVFVHNSAKQARDRHFQAILPLRGKILNTERANLNRILDSGEIKALISALGIGIRDDINLERLRYGRIIVMTDADVDGAHIRTLLLTFFFRYMTPLITDGHLYIAQPPIFRLEYRKQIEYVYPMSNLKEEQLLAQMLVKYNEPEKVGVQRYKGLGEMNPEQLWETTMNPERRTLLQVTMEDAAVADRTFDMLMGPAVPPRRKFIITHSKDATLDI